MRERRDSGASAPSSQSSRSARLATPSALRPLLVRSYLPRHDLSLFEADGRLGLRQRARAGAVEEVARHGGGALLGGRRDGRGSGSSGGGSSSSGHALLIFGRLWKLNVGLRLNGDGSGSQQRRAAGRVQGARDDGGGHARGSRQLHHHVSAERSTEKRVCASVDAMRARRRQTEEKEESGLGGGAERHK